MNLAYLMMCTKSLLLPYILAATLQLVRCIVVWAKSEYAVARRGFSTKDHAIYLQDCLDC